MPEFSATTEPPGPAEVPPADQESFVRGMIRDVSDTLFAITGGRARISSLDYVPEIKSADIIFSPTGAAGRPGFTVMSDIEGRPGHIVVFVPSLMEMPREDAIASIVHDLGHYIFGLPDEYNAPGGCPKDPPGKSSPGCLMDNYLSTGPRKGWSGTICNEGNHNPDQPEKRSCQAIVDEFFAQHKVGKGGSYGQDNPVDKVVRSTLSQVRSNPAFAKVVPKYVIMASSLSLSDLGPSSKQDDAFQEEILKILKSEADRQKIILAPAQEEYAIKRVVVALSVHLSPALDARLRREASELVTRYATNPKSIRNLIVQKRLLEIALEAPEFHGDLRPEVRCYIIEDVAKKAKPPEVHRRAPEAQVKN